MNDIKCPHCGKTIQISEALQHEFGEKIRAEEKLKAKDEIQKAKLQAISEAEKRFKDESLKELSKTKKEKEELEEKLLESAKKSKENEEKIKELAIKEASEKARLEKLEFEKKISDMQKALEEAQRKGKQGSQQLQGDILEKDLEERLKEAFPNDLFKPVPTGVRGGDIIQEVRNKHGNSAGLILWEAKRTKAWQKDWLVKLKEDMRSINASDCILVTEVMPPQTKIYERIENTWVTSYEYAIKLASVVRFGLLNMAIIRSSASHSDEQLKELYDVITSDSFRQMFEARDEIINALKIELEADKRSAEKRWKRQGAYIEKLDRNNSRLYGELQAHIPSLKPLKEPNILGSGDINDEAENSSLI
nr:DUF2130 domain-containing protein [Candidatus Levybacteria bacterium]